MPAAIQINNLFKSFLLKGNKESTSQIINNVSLTIEKGMVIGLTGKNGCGKTTLLRMIAGLTPPTKGTIEIYGRLLSIIELGAGFHQDLSGYENILYYAQILGFNAKEIRSKIDDIISFSEIDLYLHEPVKNYSKGMFLRLAYSIIVHMEADIYLFDEVFAVGDKDFKQKCINNILNLKARNKTVVITGHDFELISSVCDEVLQIEEGQIIKTKASNALLFQQLIIDQQLILNQVQLEENDLAYFLSFSLDHIDKSYNQLDVILIAEHNNNFFQRYVIEVSGTSPSNTGNICKDYRIKIEKKYFHAGEHSISVHIIKNKAEITRNYPFICSFNIPAPEKGTIASFYPGPIHLTAQNQT